MKAQDLSQDWKPNELKQWPNRQSLRRLSNSVCASEDNMTYNSSANGTNTDGEKNAEEKSSTATMFGYIFLSVFVGIVALCLTVGGSGSCGGGCC